ncbi:MAG TPA: hypothetical protein VFD30_12185 [Terriglobia bacterium]|jgi:hypothetical protein|nr:hypothetical protein [Terriglobia bacterium]
MFARQVTLHLKPNTVGEFSRTMEKEVIPLLRKQKGFQDEITFIASEGREALALSIWDVKENGEDYGRRGYPDVLKVLAKLVEGTPQVRTYEVSNSTFHTITSRTTA